MKLKINNINYTHFVKLGSCKFIGAFCRLGLAYLLLALLLSESLEGSGCAAVEFLLNNLILRYNLKI